MASPFPGMAPYLDDPAFWPDFHIEFTSALRNALRQRLTANYEARLDEQTKLIDASADAAKEIKPDVAVLRLEGEPAGASFSPRPAAVPVTLPLLIEEQEYREVWIEIRYRPDRSIVTVIEMLSPTNKSGSERGAYLAKRRAILRQNISLVEIDLLAGGKRIAPPGSVPACDYSILVARADRRNTCDLYPCQLRDALPEISVPLKPADGDVIVDLQAVFRDAFERGGYETAIDYSRPPLAPLSEIDRLWAAELANRV